ncbi:MAG: hypothetical protein COX90_01940 [Candidatus Nealsonbacteria bacterium CG_4_10_14_0_2_um_filter_38_17]|uniref:Uncharacterized protein n=3 Tax=Candidatus Nealsoniibacteriota TaxID=1817911 RepID=A0A2M7UYD7_9BACT|nr:MAG: hypothetical protein COX90_01940 [Candidatus Nealsonbacteria bacterium CG_4_10_14_0_2_um_filter_38_17]
MSLGVFFERLGNFGDQLVTNGISIESLRQEYGIDHKRIYPFANNHFLFCSDDSGTPCLTFDEFRSFRKELNNLPLSEDDKAFLNEYIEGRIRYYNSPRRGNCVALRGFPYYRMVQERDNTVLVRLLKQDLYLDAKTFNFLARLGYRVPKELSFMVVDHIKNAVFRIMYAYIAKSLSQKNFFHVEDWSLLDGLARLLWEILVHILLDDEYIILSQIRFDGLSEVLEKVSDGDFRRILELDSAKTLLRMATTYFQRYPDFDCCVDILYGGIEIGYALCAYGLFTRRPIPRFFVPAIFSLNRLKKGEIDQSILGEDGLIISGKLNEVIPGYFLEEISKIGRPKILVADNNITTGYSVRVLRDSLRKRFGFCELSVAEVNIQEIQRLCQGSPEANGRTIVLRGADLYQPPVGEYVTCFGLRDKSQVINRVKFILGCGDYTQIEGYDFDGTLFKTGALHRMSWNRALKKLGIEFDVATLPSNSGLSFREAALNIYRYLIGVGIDITLTEDMFIRELCDAKEQFLKDVHERDIISIAKAINLARMDVANTKIIVTNDRLGFVLRCLEKKHLIEYFAYLICEDYAYSVKSREKVALVGKGKPFIDAYLEASDYFHLPHIQTYYGDNDVIDREFAQRLHCDFVLIG